MTDNCSPCGDSEKMMCGVAHVERHLCEGDQPTKCIKKSTSKIR